MCEDLIGRSQNSSKTIPVEESVGTVLAHDISEIKPGVFKGRAFKKGHIVKKEDVCHLQRLGKERLFVLRIADDEMHEDDATYALATALMGEGVAMKGEPKEGRINIIAKREGLLKVHKDLLLQFNMLGDVMCATLHNNTIVRQGQVVAGTRAIPLVLKKKVVEKAVRMAEQIRYQSDDGYRGVIEVKEMRKTRAGVVITGNEVYHGRVKDAFSTVISEKITALGGEIVGISYAPDDVQFIEERLRDLIHAGADLLITTGGMSVDPDDVTRFAIQKTGAEDITYGSAVLPGAMFLIAYLPQTGEHENSREERTGTQDYGARENRDLERGEMIPVLGIPACGMYSKVTVFDIVLPRVLAGERIGRRELAELGNGGLCLKCEECRYPVCPFCKG